MTWLLAAAGVAMYVVVQRRAWQLNRRDRLRETPVPTTCPTPHRTDHVSRAAAELVARKIAERKHTDVVGYLCPCGVWHVGPRAEVEAGLVWAPAQ